MTTGTVSLDFGSFPGKTSTSSAVTGQTGFNSATSYAEAWVMPSVDTTDHTVDEQMFDRIEVFVSDFSSNTGFTIYGVSTDGNNRYGKYNVAWVWQ